jgi:hypothetical protein
MQTHFTKKNFKLVQEFLLFMAIKAPNKRVNLAHFVRWTAAPLQMRGFASQNFTTHLQSHIRRLRGRYAK